MTMPGGLLGRIFGPAGENTPEGLVSPDLLRRIGHHSLFSSGIGMLGAASRPGATFGESLARGLGVGQETYASQLQSAEKQALLGRETKESDRLTALRAELAERYAPVEGEAPLQKINRLTDAAAAYAQGNDPETAAKLAQVANALRLQVNSTMKPRYFQQGGKVTRVDPDGSITDIIDDGSLAARQEIAEANLALRGQSVGISQGRLELAKEAAERPGEAEAKSGLLVGMAQTVGPTLDAAPAPSRIAWGAAKLGISEGMNAQEQVFIVAANQFMDTYVRETSGAALNSGELARAWTIYIPTPGDKRPTLKFKAKMRQRLIALMIRKGGRATKEDIFPDGVDDAVPGSAATEDSGLGLNDPRLN